MDSTRANTYALHLHPHTWNHSPKVWTHPQLHTCQMVDQMSKRNLPTFHHLRLPFSKLVSILQDANDAQIFSPIMLINCACVCLNYPRTHECESVCVCEAWLCTLAILCSIMAVSLGRFMGTEWTQERIILLMGKRNAGGNYLPDCLSLGQKGTGHKRLDTNRDRPLTMQALFHSPCSH